MTCKGICTRYKAQKPVGAGRYASGQRRCQICEIFIKWEGLWCPCCGYRLRTKPRNKIYKEKLRSTQPQVGSMWQVFVEDENDDGMIMLVEDGKAVLMKRIGDGERVGFEVWEVMLGKEKIQRFIKT